MSSSHDVGQARWSAGEVRRVFAQGTAPDRDALAGSWDGRLVGSTWLHAAAAVTAALSPMRGWCGKRIEASGAVVNLVRRAGTVRGEIRWLTPGQDAVGVLLLPVAGRVVGPFPFVLTRPRA